MPLQIAFDFEAICTGPAQNTDARPSASLSHAAAPCAPVPRDGIAQLMSVMALFAQIIVLRVGPPEPDYDVATWIKIAGLRPFISNIHDESEHSPTDGTQQYHIRVAARYDATYNGNEPSDESVIRWGGQPWREVLRYLMGMLAAHRATLRSDIDFRLAHAEEVSDRSPAPVWILTGTDRSRRKLRVCYDQAMCERICKFLRLTQTYAYPHVAQLLDVSGLAIVKSYIPGVPISSVTSQNRRRTLAGKIGAALARLHEIPAPANGFTDTSMGTDQQLLICGADNYNTIITPDGDIAFIDLEACRGGSRWVDLIWTEELFCQSEDERVALYEGYSAVWGGVLPVEAERQHATQEYLRWLIWQLEHSLAHRPDTPDVLADLLDLQRRLQTCPC